MPMTTTSVMPTRLRVVLIPAPATTTPRRPLTPTTRCAFTRRVVRPVPARRTGQEPWSTMTRTTTVSVMPMKSKAAPTPAHATTTPTPPPTPTTPCARTPPVAKLAPVRLTARVPWSTMTRTTTVSVMPMKSKAAPTPAHATTTPTPPPTPTTPSALMQPGVRRVLVKRMAPARSWTTMPITTVSAMPTK